VTTNTTTVHTKKSVDCESAPSLALTQPPAHSFSFAGEEVSITSLGTITMAKELTSPGEASYSQESGNLEDDMKEVVVWVRGVEASTVTTIVKFVSIMIEAATSEYETLYDLNVDESIKMVFKFGPSVDKIQGGGTVMEGEIKIVCKHEHPYLFKKVWLATKRHMETTVLKGKNKYM
jgi:hypothetical protein